MTLFLDLLPLIWFAERRAVQHLLLLLTCISCLKLLPLCVRNDSECYLYCIVWKNDPVKTIIRRHKFKRPLKNALKILKIM